MALDFHRVLAAVVVFVVTGLITTCSGLVQDAAPEGVEIVLVGYIILALISIAIINWNYTSKYERQQSAMHQGHTDNRPRDKLEHVLEEFALPVGLVIFGATAVSLRIFYFMADLQCFVFHQENPDQSHMFEFVCRMVFNSSMMVFQCIQLPFLIKLHTLKWMKVAYRLHHLLLLIAGADFVVWLHSFYKDTKLMDQNQISFGITPLHPGETLAKACLNFSSATDYFITSTLDHTLLSFNMKFMLASLEVLLHVWTLPLMLPEVGEKKPLIAPIPENSTLKIEDTAPKACEVRHRTNTPAQLLPLLNDQILTANSNTESAEAMNPINDDSLCIISREDLSNTLKDKSSSPLSCIHCLILGTICNFYTALLAGLLDMVLLQFYVVNYSATINSYNSTTYMSPTYFTHTVGIPAVGFNVGFTLIPAVLVSVHCAVVLSKSRKVRPNSSRLTGNYVILALCNGANLLLSCYELTVYITRLKTLNTKVVDFLSVVEVALIAVQYLSQSLVVYYGQRRQVSGHSGHTSLQTILTYLAMYNFIEWVKDSFVMRSFLSQRNGIWDTDEHGIKTWTVFTELFLPPCTYFRYTCCLLLLRVKRLVGDTEEIDGEDFTDEEVREGTSRKNYGAIDGCTTVS